MDTFTRNLLAELVPLSMGILAILSFNSGLYVHSLLWALGLISVRLSLSKKKYATSFRNFLKEEYALARSAAEFADRHLLRS